MSCDRGRSLLSLRVPYCKPVVFFTFHVLNADFAVLYISRNGYKCSLRQHYSNIKINVKRESALNTRNYNAANYIISSTAEKATTKVQVYSTSFSAVPV